MPTHTPGNGSGKFNVNTQDLGGWVRVFTDSMATVPDDVALFLSHALTEWFRQRPHLPMRTVIPITRDGRTVELNAWYDLGVFPELAGQHPRSGAASG
jgi:hypothetical protein